MIFALGLSEPDKLTSGLSPSDRKENPDNPGDEALPICEVRRVAAAAPPDTKAESRLRGCTGEAEVATGADTNRQPGAAAGPYPDLPSGWANEIRLLSWKTFPTSCSVK